MLQQLLIGLIFLVALGYLGARAWKSFFRRETGCAKGCGCDTTKEAKAGTANKSNRLPV